MGRRLTPPPSAGALADRYRIDAELGVGGMATVYRARDLRHDRDVAIKVMHPERHALGCARHERLEGEAPLVLA